VNAKEVYKLVAVGAGFVGSHVVEYDFSGKLKEYVGIR